MIKFIPAVLVLLGASVGFAAPITKLSCANEFEKTLEIISDSTLNTVTAVFVSNGAGHIFEGAILPTGVFDMKPTAANEPVKLQLGRSRDHGGGCGRCAVDVSPGRLTAQLVVGTSGYVFQCQETEL